MLAKLAWLESSAKTTFGESFPALQENTLMPQTRRHVLCARPQFALAGERPLILVDSPPSMELKMSME